MADNTYEIERTKPGATLAAGAIDTVTFTRTTRGVWVRTHSPSVTDPIYVTYGSTAQGDAALAPSSSADGARFLGGQDQVHFVDSPPGGAFAVVKITCASSVVYSVEEG